MAAIYATLFWCALQVTIFLTLAAPIYLVVRGRSPHAATFAAVSSLAAVILLSALAASPWPRWSLTAADRDRVALASVSPITTDIGGDPAAPSSKKANATAGSDATPSAASPLAALWETVQFAATPATSTMTAGAPAAEPGLHWSAVVVALFLAGMTISGVYLAAGLVAVHRLIACSHPLDEAPITAELDRLRQQLRILRPVSLHVSSEIATPATVGWRRPAILLPPTWRTWSDVERRSVLAHELAHIAQHDFAAWLVARGAIALHFYHPLVRWFAGRLQLDQELAADAAAVRLIGDREGYLHSLAGIALHASSFRLAGPANAFIPNRSLLTERIETLSRTDASSPLRMRSRAIARIACIAMLSGLSVAVTGFRPATAELADQSLDREATALPVQVGGVVVDDDGAPVTGALIVCAQIIDGAWKEWTTRSRDDGAFHFELTAPNVDHRTRHVWAFAKGHGIRCVNLAKLLRDSSPELNNIEIRLPPAEVLTLTVIASDLKPLAGAVVCPQMIDIPNGVFAADEPTGLSTRLPEELAARIRQTTDSEGRVTFNAIPLALLGSVRVEAVELGIQDFRPVKEQLHVGAVGRIEGAIISDEPHRLKGVKLHLETRHAEGVSGEAVATVDEHGRFEVPAIASGLLSVRLLWPEELPTQPSLQPFRRDVEPGKTLRLDIWEEPAVTLRGRIVAGDGRTPVAGARVFVRHVESPGYGQRVDTDSNGAFAAKTLAGQTSIQVVSFGDDDSIAMNYDHPRLPHISVPADVSEHQLPEIVLQPKVVLEGTLRRADDSPSAGTTIGLRRNNSFRHLSGQATTDASGAFRMPVSDWKLTNEHFPNAPREWLLISQPTSLQESPTQTPLNVLSEEPLVLQER